ncbi:MAG: TonB-dependent receptor plug domain-containing protein [Acidobacteria bacterium]|nr:TonB-dependent receptor plug domain-containing protein [Acidobacteriota bacterium]
MSMPCARTWFRAAVATAWLLAAVAANAQSFTSRLDGTVTDPSGAAVPGVQVTLQNANTGQVRTEETNENGFYRFSALGPGTYDVTVESPGFQQKRTSGIVVQVNQTVQIDIQLVLGDVTETVEVTGSAPLVNTSDPSVAQVIGTKSIEDLPLNGRDFLSLAMLTAGVEQRKTSRGKLSVNGTRGNGLGYLFDGVDANDANAIFQSLTPSLEAIQEFSIQTSNYSAEFGRNAGGQINLVTKSGTNELHGTLFHFLRNAKLDAKNYFVPHGDPNPPFKRNQFGGVLSGPIIKNKLFYLGNYEGFRIRQGITALATVPTAAERVGDFSQTFNANTGALIVVKDPATGQAFANNMIPTQRLDPTGLKILELYPLPNRSGAQNFVSSPSSSFDQDAYTGRVDYQATEKDSLFGRYFATKSNETNPFGRVNGAGGTNVPGFPVIIPVLAQNVSLNWTRILSPSTVMELRSGYHRYYTGRTQDTSRNLLESLGIEGPFEPAEINDGSPLISITGLTTLGDRGELPQIRPQNTYHFWGSVSHTVGRHSLKMGAELRALQENLILASTVRGNFVFNNTYTGYAPADVLTGLPTRVSYTSNSYITGMRDKQIGGYFQDDWKVSQKLTVNLGLRYDFFHPVYDRYDHRANIDFTTAELVRVGENGLSRAGYNKDLNNFAPRLGFAYTPFGDAHTVVRGGYGVFYDKENFNTHINLFQQPLFATSLTFNNPGSISRAVLTTPQTSTGSANAQEPDFKDAYYQHWNLMVEKDIAKDTMISVGYVGSKGARLPGRIDLNAAYPGTTGSVQSRRPLSQYTGLNYTYSGMASIYHSLQVRAEKRFTERFSFLGNYTWSRAIDDGPLYGNAVQNDRNTRAERGLSSTHSPHRLVGSFIYELPLLTNSSTPLRMALGGWQVNGILSALSGTPYNPTVTADIAGIGRAGQRPDRLGDGKIDNWDPERYFDASAFTPAARGTFGNSGRNILLGPGLRNVDFSLFKNFLFKESHQIQFRAEFFNLTNTPNFDLPATAVDAANTVGRISSTLAANRQIQFGLKYIF